MAQTLGHIARNEDGEKITMFFVLYEVGMVVLSLRNSKHWFKKKNGNFPAT